jgi:glycine cleavage system transcriptional repressor
VKTLFVITVTCPDRPGVVERVTEVVVAHGANWEASRMARLGGEFAGIVLVSVAEQHADALAQSLSGLSDDQMTVEVRVTRPSPAVAAGLRSCQIQLTGADHEGIVHTVAAYLASQGSTSKTWKRISWQPPLLPPLCSAWSPGCKCPNN